jgi:hypothetical protein
MRALALVGLLLLAPAPAVPTREARYTDDGRLLLPEDYREWVFLGSGLGMTYGPLGAARGFLAQFDNVFVLPEAHRAFLETGRWPDGTVFLLEVRYAASHGSINRDGHFQTDLSGLEAHVIDSRRFEERSRFFNFPVQGGKPGPSARALGRDAGCFACHTKSAAVETTFVQFYPTLLEVAEKKGTLRPDFAGAAPSPVRLYHTLVERGWPDAQRTLEAARADDAVATVVNPAVLNMVGYELLTAKRADLAVPLFGWIAAAHPESANAQDSLAEALEAAGQTEQARGAARKALDLAATDKTLNDAQRKQILEANRKRAGERRY